MCVNIRDSYCKGVHRANYNIEMNMIPEEMSACGDNGLLCDGLAEQTVEVA